MVLNQVFHDMKEAWHAVSRWNSNTPVRVNLRHGLANIVSPSEVVVVSTFHAY